MQTSPITIQSIENRPLAQTGRRLKYADAQRALAITLVVLLHAAASMVSKGYAQGKSYWWAGNLADSAARICVPLLVMVSGMLLLNPERQESLSQFFRKRFARVVIPLLGWWIIYIFWRVFYEGETITPVQAVRALLANDIAYHFWFIYMILGLYLATPVLRVFTRQASEKDILYFLGAWFAAVTIAPFLKRFTGTTLAVDWVVMTGYAGYYLAGYYLSRVPFSRGAKIWVVAIYLASLLVTITGTYLLLRSGGEYDSYFYEFLSPNVILMSLAAFVLLRDLPYERWYLRIPWLGSLAGSISMASFGIYMVHVMILAALKGGRLGFVLSGASFVPGAGLLITFAVSMSASLVIVLILQRVPILKSLAPR